MIGSNWRLAMGEDGAAVQRLTWGCLESAIAALASNDPIESLEVNYGKESRPLDIHLIKTPSVSEADAFFSNRVPFNIGINLPLGLREYHNRFNLDKKQAQRALKRFYVYTWNKEPSVQKAYYCALKSISKIDARGTIDKSSGESGRLSLKCTIDALQKTSQLQECPSINHLINARENVSYIESKIAEIPQERFLDLFTKAGRERIKKRNEMSTEYESKIQKATRDLIAPLSAIGREYRIIYQRKQEEELENSGSVA